MADKKDADPNLSEEYVVSVEKIFVSRGEGIIVFVGGETVTRDQIPPGSFASMCRLGQLVPVDEYTGPPVGPEATAPGETTASPTPDPATTTTIEPANDSTESESTDPPTERAADPGEDTLLGLSKTISDKLRGAGLTDRAAVLAYAQQNDGFGELLGPNQTSKVYERLEETSPADASAG